MGRPRAQLLQCSLPVLSRSILGTLAARQEVQENPPPPSSGRKYCLQHRPQPHHPSPEDVAKMQPETSPSPTFFCPIAALGSRDSCSHACLLERDVGNLEARCPNVGMTHEFCCTQLASQQHRAMLRDRRQERLLVGRVGRITEPFRDSKRTKERGTTRGTSLRECCVLFDHLG